MILERGVRSAKAYIGDMPQIEVDKSSSSMSMTFIIIIDITQQDYYGLQYSPTTVTALVPTQKYLSCCFDVALECPTK